MNHILIFQNIRNQSKNILENSKDLLIVNYELIDELLLSKLLSFKGKSTPKSIFIRNELTTEIELGLNIFFNAVNFCFKDPNSQQEYYFRSKGGNVFLRSTGLFIALAESQIDWSNFIDVAKLDQKRWVKLTQLDENNILYRGRQRVERLNNLAKFLLNTKNISVEILLQNADFQADTLVNILVESGVFYDEYFKRAQVAVHAVYNVLLRRKNIRLKNIEKLTCMADYRIPQVFYNLDVVSLNPGLKKIISSGQIIEAGSREELALRSSVIVIGQILSEKMKITEVEVDLLLWNLPQDMAKKNEFKTPHMLVATDKY